jgi:ABC-type transporter Mla subunit MlaD
MPEWREKAKELRKHRSVIEDLQRGAKRLAARSAELERLIDAAKPLYDSLDDAKRSLPGASAHHYRKTLVSRTRRLSSRLAFRGL